MAAAYEIAVETELEASLGVEDAIKQILPVKLCVASNGEPDTIDQCVSAVGLKPYFGENLFSARQVENPKPAPDSVFVRSKSMGVKPSACLVIEDTVLGIKAAQAAGMRVIGYAGNHPEMAEQLKETGATVIIDYAELPALVLS